MTQQSEAPTSADAALFTDQYELTMVQGYLETGHNPTTTFSLYFRCLPTDRGYVVAARLEQVVEYPDSLTYLATLDFSERFLRFLDRF